MWLKMIEVKTKDGTLTLKSEKYNECYHSSEGAFIETYYKHVKPAFDFVNFLGLKEVKILDICFGLGYNTFSTIYYIKKNSLKTKVNIISPEFDEELISSLSNFDYPKEFDNLQHIIQAISTNLVYEDEHLKIQVIIDDARAVIRSIDVKFNIVYQDAFSSDVNQELWTQEYFSQISKILSAEAIITTYSIATAVRLAMWNNNLNIYLYPALQSDSTNGHI